MIVPSRKHTCAQTAIHAKTVIQPWSKDQKAGDMNLFGAYSAVHRYCAPTTGVIEAISPRDAASAVEPKMQRSVPQTRAVEPPFSSPAWNETERASHEDCNVASKAMVAANGMYLCGDVSCDLDSHRSCVTHIESLH